MLCVNYLLLKEKLLLETKNIKNTSSIRVSPIIYENDYDTYIYMGGIASRIASDMRFDEKCRKNAKRRDEYKHGK